MGMRGLTYSALHSRIRYYRGRAADQQCVGCPAQARDWAQIHTEDGTDIWADYVPLCRTCHIHYDWDARQNPATKAKWRHNATPSIRAAWTPEKRADQAALTKSQWTPERRERQRERNRMRWQGMTGEQRSQELDRLASIVVPGKGSRKCPDGCTCGRHSGRSRPKCLPGCTCGRHRR